MSWRRADEGDLPERDTIISMVKYSTDVKNPTMTVYERMRVEIVFADPTPRIFGPMLPTVGEEPLGDIPPKPDNPSGKYVLLWRERS